MPEIAQWLEELGLGQYAQRFAENDIDLAILLDLTDQDLKEVGVSSLGHRRQLPRAIAEFDQATAASTAPAPASASSAAPAEAAERRHVTVMFSDLVGSTALSARMDPEDLREVMATYQKCVTEIVRRFDGFVAKYMGDGVLVYFGYPQAHEDDAERAARAALEMISAVSQLAAPIALQTRVGVATGLVVVGEMIGWGATQEPNIVGETPNLRRDCKGSRSPTGWSSPKVREGCSAVSSSLRTSARRISRASPDRHGCGRRCAQARSRAGSKRCTQAASPPWSGAKKKPNCCCGAGRGQREAKARWCCSPARPVSENRG